jgi:hypothetical protein
MLSTMRALTEGARGLAYVAAAHCDVAHRHPDPERRAEHQALYEYLVPIVKGWSTEMSLEVTSLGVQVHGGMGFIEETGAAQYYRDARILPIYEGTTAIQANDLVGRKTARDGGAVARSVIAQIDATLAALREHASYGSSATLQAMHRHLSAGRDALASAVRFVIEHASSEPNAVFAGSVSYLMLAGIVLSGWQLARSLLIAAEKRTEDPAFYETKIATAHSFATQVLPRAVALEAAIVCGRNDEGFMTLCEEQF